MSEGGKEGETETGPGLGVVSLSHKEYYTTEEDQ
jgi:hypothetical protein